MNPTARELFRLALLRVLDSNTSGFGLTPQTLGVLVAEFGFSPRPDETQKEIDYLADKSFVTVVGKNISPENRAWRITATGRDELAQRG